jgi:hypothetical protein
MAQSIAHNESAGCLADQPMNDTENLMSLKEEGPAAFAAPANACDAHFHVFGPPGAYPYADGLRYTPPHAPWSEYQHLARHLGLVRFVFVQPSAYGLSLIHI